MDINGVTYLTASAGYEGQPAISATAARTTLHSIGSKEPPAQEISKMDQERMQKMVEDIQKNLSNLDVRLQFSTYGVNNNQISIIVSEKATGNIIREIPSKELQALYTKMQELVGMIFNKQA